MEKDVKKKTTSKKTSPKTTTKKKTTTVKKPVAKETEIVKQELENAKEIILADKKLIKVLCHIYIFMHMYNLAFIFLMISLKSRSI